MARRRSIIGAATAGDLPEVIRLHKEGADIERVLANGHNALRGAISNEHIEVAEYLLNAGANVAATSQLGWSSLYIATRNLDLASMNLLINQGANPNQRTNSRASTAHVAAENNFIGGLELLIEAGSKVTHKDQDGYTPLHLAAQQNAAEAIPLLVNAGANPSERDKQGYSPLHYAAELGNIEAVVELLKHSPDLECKYKGRWVPVHLYEHNRGDASLDALRLFSGGYGDDSVTRGSTPLHCAIREGHVAIVTLLLQAGADVMACTKDGLTAIKVAASADQTKIVQLIEQQFPSAVEHNTSGILNYTDVPKGLNEVAQWISAVLADANNGFFDRHNFDQPAVVNPPRKGYLYRHERGGIILSNDLLHIRLMVIVGSELDADDDIPGVEVDIQIESKKNDDEFVSSSVTLGDGAYLTKKIDELIAEIMSDAGGNSEFCDMDEEYDEHPFLKTRVNNDTPAVTKISN